MKNGKNKQIGKKIHGAGNAGSPKPDLGPATGPLTQATGPPHSVWGGGNLYVEGEPRTNRKFNVGRFPWIPLLTGYLMLNDSLGSTY